MSDKLIVERMNIGQNYTQQTKKERIENGSKN